jgi:hypothetical protein
MKQHVGFKSCEATTKVQSNIFNINTVGFNFQTYIKYKTQDGILYKTQDGILYKTQHGIL